MNVCKKNEYRMDSIQEKCWNKEKKRFNKIDFLLFDARLTFISSKLASLRFQFFVILI